MLVCVITVFSSKYLADYSPPTHPQCVHFFNAVLLSPTPVLPTPHSSDLLNKTMLAFGLLAAVTMGGYEMTPCPVDTPFCSAIAREDGVVSSLAVHPNAPYMAGTVRGESDKHMLFIRTTETAQGEHHYGMQPDILTSALDGTNSVKSLVFAPDGTTLVISTTLDGVKVMRNLASPIIGSLTARNSQALAYHPHNAWVASGYTNVLIGNDPPEVNVYNVDTLAVVASLQMVEGGAITELAFSPDGDFLAYSNAESGVVVVFSTADWTRLATLSLSNAKTVKFSADSSALMAGSTDGQVVRWSFPLPPADAVAKVLLPRVTGGRSGFAWSPDGRRVATFSDAHLFVYVYDVMNYIADPQSIIKLGVSSTGFDQVIFRSDNIIQACAARSTTCNMSTIPPVAALPSPVPTIVPALPMDTPLPTVGDTEAPSACVQPNTLTGTCSSILNCALKIHHLEPVRSVAFSPDSSMLATGSDDGVVRLYEAGTGAFLRHAACVDFIAYDIVFSPDSTRFAVGGAGGSLVVCDSATGVALLHLPVHSSMPVTRVSFSEDGEWVISAGSDSAVRKYSTMTAGKPDLVIQGYTRDAVFSAGGASIASVGTRVTDPVVVWDADNGAKKEELDLILGDVRSLSFSSNATHLARGYPDGKVRVWHAGADRLTLSLPSGFLFDAAFSPNDAYLAAVGLGDVVVWDAATGAVASLLAAHTSVVSRLAFSPDSTRLATAGHDGAVYVWNLH